MMGEDDDGRIVVGIESLLSLPLGEYINKTLFRRGLDLFRTEYRNFLLLFD